MNEFEKCLERRSLVRFEHAGPDVIERELASAREDLTDLDLLLENGRWKRATITGYYAMFHAARALVLDKGYAEKSHYCLVVAFRELYGDTDDGRFLGMALARGRSLRENADYNSEFSKESGSSIATAARRFVAFAEGLLIG